MRTMNYLSRKFPPRLPPTQQRPLHSTMTMRIRRLSSHAPAFPSSPAFPSRWSPSLYVYRQFSASSNLAVASPLKTAEIQDYIATLDEEGRALLVQELKTAAEAQVEAEAEATETSPPRPTFPQLRSVFVLHMLPFIGFGFLDNAIMITAGDYIDTTIGVTLAISTMAAAGFGNLLADLGGLSCAHFVENLVIMLGMRPPKLSFKQREMGVTRFAANVGRGVGVTIGCLLGMFPLLFLGGREREEECDESKQVGVNDEEGGEKNVGEKEDRIETEGSSPQTESGEKNEKMTRDEAPQ